MRITIKIKNNCCSYESFGMISDVRHAIQTEQYSKLTHWTSAPRTSWCWWTGWPESQHASPAHHHTGTSTSLLLQSPSNAHRNPCQSPPNRPHQIHSQSKPASNESAEQTTVDNCSYFSQTAADLLWMHEYLDLLLNCMDLFLNCQYQLEQYRDLLLNYQYLPQRDFHLSLGDPCFYCSCPIEIFYCLGCTINFQLPFQILLFQTDQVKLSFDLGDLEDG